MITVLRIVCEPNTTLPFFEASVMLLGWLKTCLTNSIESITQLSSLAVNMEAWCSHKMSSTFPLAFEIICHYHILTKGKFDSFYIPFDRHEKWFQLKVV